MTTEITLPDLGERVTEATINAWFKGVGDDVIEGEPLLEVSTDTVDSEVPSPVTGTLLTILAPTDTVVTLGDVIATVATRSSEETGASGRSVDATANPRSAVPVSLLVQRAAARGVAVDAVDGSGLGGRVRLLDIERAEVTSAPEPVQTPYTVTVPVLRRLPSLGAPTTLPRMAGSRAASVADPAVTVQGVVPVSLLVRRAAAVRGVDLDGIEGSGLGGRVRLLDVETAAATHASQPELAPYVAHIPKLHPLPALTAPSEHGTSAAASTAASPQAATAGMAGETPEGVALLAIGDGGGDAGSDQATSTPATLGARDTEVQLTRLRRTIAQRMVDSLQTSAQLTSVIDIDMTAVTAARQAHGDSFQGRNGIKLSYMPFIAAAAIRALATNPRLNASLTADGTAALYHGAVNLSVAVDTERGLLAPVVPNADDLTLGALGRAIDDIAHRARAGTVTPDELNGGTFTLSNTGSRGSLFDTPILNRPQVAILATGAIKRMPRVVALASGEETIAIRSVAYFALTFDHQLVDGADAARYLSTIQRLLEDASFVEALLAGEGNT